MKWFITWIALIVATALIACCSGCTALETVAANNKDKAVTINSETWGGRIVAEMVSVGSSVLPNLTLAFGKTNTYYNAVPISASPEMVKALAEHIKASNSSVTAGASGMSSK